MIILLPSTGLVRDTQIDYDLLSFILSKIVFFKKKVFFQLQKSKQDYSYYEEIDDNNIIALNLKNIKNRREVIATILHEIRHYIQDKKFKVKCEEFYSTFSGYKNSPEERDARQFEKLSTEVLKIYENFKRIELKYKELQLDQYAVHS